MDRIIVAIAAVGLTAGSCGIGRERVLTQAQRMSAEIGARRFADGTGDRFASCYPRDSNGDGYVPCTMRDTREDTTYELKCAYDESKIGCRRK